MQVASGTNFRAHFGASDGAGPRWLAVLVLLLTCSVRAAAEERGEPPRSEPAAPAAAVWYRSGEGCPDGAAFIELLRQRSVPAQLAQVGDRIDFVVTLGAGPDGGRGRLERQAEQGTVALREVQGKTCEGVADALALSLALTWDPNTQPPVPEVTPSSSEPPAPERDAAPALTAATPPPSPALPAVRAPQPEPSRNVRIGLNGSVWSLSERTAFFGGSVFGEVRGSRVGAGLRPLIRLSAELAFSPELGNDVQGFIGAARVEGCPVRIGSSLLQLRPCTGFDLGMLRVAGGGRAGASSSGFWAAWSTHGRLSWETGATWGLDVQAGVIVPLTRYELTVGEPAQSVAELRRWGIAVGIGAHWAPP
jgi:hypothetical protein